MELILKPEHVDVFYQAVLKEPMLDVVLEEKRIPLIKKFLKSFDLRLNDLKFGLETLSDNYIRFSKFYGPSFFDVSFGLETISATLRMPTSEEQAIDLYKRLSRIFKEKLVSRQKMSVQRQLSTEKDTLPFLQSLSPYTPEGFRGSVYGKGVIYDLKVPEHGLAIHVVIASSLFVERGLFLNIECDFLPNQYDLETAFKIAKDKHDFILKELKLKIETEA